MFADPTPGVPVGVVNILSETLRLRVFMVQHHLPSRSFVWQSCNPSDCVVLGVRGRDFRRHFTMIRPARKVD